MHKKCISCKGKFRPYSQVAKQSYCSKPLCQKERKRQWQKEKRKADPDYRENQKRAQQNWLKRNPDYWRKYRSKKKSITQRKLLAELELIAGKSPMPGGFFRITPLLLEDAKMDVWIVEIKFIPSRSKRGTNCKERT